MNPGGDAGMRRRPPAPFFARPSGRNLALLGGLLLMVLALKANLQVLNFPFMSLMDDDKNIYSNPFLGGLSPHRLHWMFTDWTYARRYIPLGWLGLCATYGFSGLDPVLYHAASLKCHVINTGLVYALLLHVLRVFPWNRRNLRAPSLDAWKVASALLAAAWWSFHPMRVESTAWASGVLYGQSMLFFLIGLLLYLRAYLVEEQGGNRAVCVWGSTVACGLSLLSYPLIFGAPVLLLLLDLLHARRASSEQAGPRLRRAVLEKIPLAAVVGAALFIAVRARTSAAVAWAGAPTLHDFPLVHRTAQVFYVIAYYAWRPWSLAPFSPCPDALAGLDPWAPRFVVCAAAVLAATAVAVAFLRPRPAPAVLWLGYVAMILPFCGFFETTLFTSDRYGYFATVIAAAAAAALLASLQNGAARWLLAGAFCVLTATQARITAHQIGLWSDRHLLYDQIVRNASHQETRDSFAAWEMYLDFVETGRAGPAGSAPPSLSTPALREMAVTIARESRSIPPGIPPIAWLHTSLGVRFSKSGDLAEADEHFRQALKWAPGYSIAAYDRSLLLLKLGRPAEALHDYLWAEARSNPKIPPANRRAFLDILSSEAAARGNKPLADAAAEHSTEASR